MNAVVYTLLISVFITDFVFKVFGGSFRYLSWVPELISLCLMLYVVFRVATTRVINIHPKYVLLLALFGLIVVSGIVINSVQSGAIVAGIRTYGKYLPLFLLPAVYPFSEEQIKKQLILVVALLFMQLPIVLFQRFVLFKGVDSGDQIVGTLNISSMLSICLIAGIAVMVAFYVKKRISLVPFVVGFLVLFLPTTLNETKGTLILLPVAIMIPSLISAFRQRNPLILLPVFLGLFVAMGAFISLYDKSLGQSEERSLLTFINSGEYQSYLDKRLLQKENLSETKGVGKVGSYLLAIEYLSDDLSKLSFGIGIGNVSQGFSKTLVGEYDKYARFEPQTTAVSYLIWETGLVGLLLVFIGCGFVVRDSIYLSHEKGLLGALALGWAAVAVIYALSLGYKNIINHNAIGFIFWFFSGQISVFCLRLRGLSRKSWPVIQSRADIRFSS